MSEPVKRCAIYTRKSTTSGLEKDFTSLDAQRETCELFIRSQAHAGWVVLEDRYDDGGFTGANLERPGFRQMMLDIEAGKIDIVVIYKLDRLSRSLLDFATVMGKFAKQDVGLVSVTQNFSTTTAMGRLTLNMLVSFAEFEREMIVERTRDKVGAARRKGKWTGGMPPLGYASKDGKLEIIEEEAELVRLIFEIYAQHHSLFRVVEELRKEGYRTKSFVSKTGNVWSAKAWTKHAVLRVLKTPVVAGLIHHNGELFRAEHEAVISEELFYQVREMLEHAPSQNTPSARNPDYLLRGVLKCSRCGAGMTPASTKRKGKVYRYYRCVTRDKQGKGGCEAPSIPATEVEELVVGYVRAFAKRKDAIEEVKGLVQKRIEERMAAFAPRKKELVEQIAKMSQRMAGIFADLESTRGKSELAREALLSRLEQAQLAVNQLQGELATLEEEQYALDSARAESGWVAGILEDFEEMWGIMTPENRGKLVEALLSKVTVDDRSGAVKVELAVLSQPIAGGMK